MACENSIDTVEVRQWTQTDRANLETKLMPIDDFIDAFTAMLKKLTIHNFTAKMQARFVQETKENLKEGEYLVIADFRRIILLLFKTKFNCSTGTMGLQQYTPLYVITKQKESCVTYALS